MRCVVVRHGRTAGNDARKYLGCRTDESLTKEGRNDLKVFKDVKDAFDVDPAKAIIVSSPMKRAIETAERMFPEIKITTEEDLRETDFGKFEGKTYEDLNGDPDYQAWIDSGGTMQIPGGESMDSFRSRSMDGFRKALAAAVGEGKEMMIITAHGGTVMAVMSSLFGGNYYDYYTLNGDGYIFGLEVDDAGDFTAAGTYDSFCGRVRA